MRLKTLFVSAGLLFATHASATTIMRVTLTCPVGGEKFKTALAASGTSFGQNLDFQLYGPIISPWPVARCPSNGFIMYKNEFTNEELAQLKPFVTSEQYQQMAKRHTNYYLIAQLLKYMKGSPEAIADALLKATWEANDKQYPAYAEEALNAFKVLEQAKAKDDRERITRQLLTGELERRLQQWEAADARFRAIASDPALEDQERAVIELQLQLIKTRISSTQPVPRIKDKTQQ